MKRILIVTGQSGSGKSSALQVLEDLGYYCIDNLPLALLPEIVAKLDHENNLEQLALGVIFEVLVRICKSSIMFLNN
jgi:UPF0042 nucleotide-binding protein